MHQRPFPLAAALLAVVSLLPLFLLVPAVRAQEGGGIHYESTELAPGLFMLQGVGGFAGGNIGLVVGDEVVLIDDGVPQLTETLLGAIGKRTTAPIDFLINTHVHFDHTGGNAVLGARGVKIVGHDNLWTHMLRDNEEAEAGKAPHAPAALPVLTFADRLTFHVNGRRAVAFHLPHAHTDTDVAIHFPDDDVIHCGDVLFNGMFPFIDLDGGGSVEGYLAAQQSILDLAGDATKIVPGHGPLATKKDLAGAHAMLADAYARVKALVAAGKNADEIVAANPLADHESWSWQFVTTERMTRALVRGAREAASGAR